MPIGVYVGVPVSSKEPKEVVKEFVGMVRSNTTEIDSLKINLSLICSSDAGVLLRLAERLPLKALGFKTGGVYRDQTAGEFRAAVCPGLSSFQGDLTAHLQAAEAMSLIEDLLNSSARAIRSTSFGIGISNVRFKDSSPDFVGSVYLSDLKHFNRAKRFSIDVNLSCAVENPKSPEFREKLKRISAATGIPFDKASIRLVPAVDRGSPDYARSTLIGQISFDEAVMDAATDTHRRLISEFAPNALSRRKAFDSRLEQWGSQASEKVNLTALLKRAVKEALPDFKFDSAEGDEIIFQKPLTVDSHVRVTFFKSNPRLGKSFTLVLGICSSDKAFSFESNAFRLEGSTEEKSWIYGTEAEAAAVVGEAVDLVKQILPRFESALRSYFDPWPRELPTRVEQQGKLTAREAFAKALPLARSEFPDAELIRVFNRPRSLNVRDAQGPELSFDGKLNDNSAWWFHFHSPEKDVSFEITVPALGRLQFLDHGEQYRDVNTRRILSAVGEDWIDSDRVLANAEALGGSERRDSAKVWGLATKLQMSDSQRPYWAVRYLANDERGRNDLIVNLDAISGEALNDIRGF